MNLAFVEPFIGFEVRALSLVCYFSVVYLCIYFQIPELTLTQQRLASGFTPSRDCETSANKNLETKSTIWNDPIRVEILLLLNNALKNAPLLRLQRNTVQRKESKCDAAEPKTSAPNRDVGNAPKQHQLSKSPPSFRHNERTFKN